MKAKFISTEGDFLEAKIEIHDQIYSVMDDFNGSRFTSGDDLKIRLSEYISDEFQWDAIFNANHKKVKKLEHIRSWSYFALGQIISVSPVIVDCGIIQIKNPFSTNDPSCIGEFVGFTVARLDANDT